MGFMWVMIEEVKRLGHGLMALSGHRQSCAKKKKVYHQRLINLSKTKVSERTYILNGSFHKMPVGHS